MVDRADKATLQGMVRRKTSPDAIIYTDESVVYVGLSRRHETVKHSVGEYARGMASANGMESFWSMLKRGYVGICHWMSVKYLDRYATEFEGRRNNRPNDTLSQMADLARGCVDKRLRYEDLIGWPHTWLNGQTEQA